MSDLIERQAVMDGLEKYHNTDMNIDGLTYAYDLVCKLPSVSTENKEDIHREREQAYMKGYEDASKRYRIEPCDDAISRSDAIRVASGYCHWSNIPKELGKLPSVNTEKTGRWEKHSYFKDAYICSACNTGGNMVYKDFKYCPNCGAKMGVEE